MQLTYTRTCETNVQGQQESLAQVSSLDTKWQLRTWSMWIVLASPNPPHSQTRGHKANGKHCFPTFSLCERLRLFLLHKGPIHGQSVRGWRLGLQRPLLWPRIPQENNDSVRRPTLTHSSHQTQREVADRKVFHVGIKAVSDDWLEQTSMARSGAECIYGDFEMRWISVSLCLSLSLSLSLFFTS